MGMKDRWKGKGPQEAKRKERSRGKGEGDLEYRSNMCSALWKCIIGNHIDLPPKNALPPFGLPTQKSWRRHWFTTFPHSYDLLIQAKG